MSKRIGTLLTTVIPDEHSWKIKLFGYWDNIIGSLKEKARIEKITNNSLTIGVCHPAWAQELFLLSPMLKKKINGFLREEKIKNITFKTVTFGESRAVRRVKREGPTPGDSIEHCLNIIEHSHLQAIKNDELAHEMGRFCIRCKKIKQ